MKTAYLIFSNVSGIPWKWIFKKNFQHVSLFLVDEGIYISPSESGMQIKQGISLSEIIAKNKVIKINYWRTSKVKLGRAFSCVSLVKYILGAEISGITPYGLYKACMKRKGSIINVTLGG